MYKIYQGGGGGEKWVVLNMVEFFFQNFLLFVCNNCCNFFVLFYRICAQYLWWISGCVYRLRGYQMVSVIGIVVGVRLDYRMDGLILIN